MSETKTLYDKDFVAWSREQAAALRSAARTGSNQKLDWENLAEEIESLGRSERRELGSRISTIIEHLIKLGHSIAHAPRNGWRQTIRRERVEIERLLEDSPSLKREMVDLVKKEIKRTAETAIEDLAGRDELTPAFRQTLKTKSYLDQFSYTQEQILGDWFPPEPPTP
jgi:hypothetical protein